ncbi:MAG: helix-turn-helix transcriptional regulator [Planctomycetota bacterium]
MKISRIHRLLRLVALLQREVSCDVDELAEDLQVSRRTVFRDLNMLEMARIPYYYDAERGGYRLSKHFFLPPVNLDLSEALSLMLLASRRKAPAASPHHEHAARAAMKLECVLPAPVRAHVGSILPHIDVRVAPQARQEGVDTLLTRLAGAITARRACRMVYISFHERKQLRLTVHPRRLVFVQRAWYLRAFSGHFGENRTFKLSRIKALDVLERTFPPPPADNADEPFGQAWCMIPEGTCHDVHLRFDRQVAGSVAEVQWHPSQRIAWADDGTLDFHVRVDGLSEITAWILGYGPHVRVLAPEALIGRMEETTACMAALYRGRGA